MKFHVDALHSFKVMLGQGTDGLMDEQTDKRTDKRTSR